MQIRPASITLTASDYCAAFNRKEILVDRRYQRNANVWVPRVQSYLIETILRGFPIPKLTVHQLTDVKNRKTIKYIVDGQQRTYAIVDFFNGKLRLPKKFSVPGAEGLTFDELSEDLQGAFLSYPIQFDQFEAVGEEVIREYFRRINSFTAPLNAEEARNAEFQGGMKWLILSLTDAYSETLLAMGTLTEREVIRMADDKLFAEIVHAMLNGVTTTTARTLSAMYKDYDRRDIPRQVEIEAAINGAFNAVADWRQLERTPLLTRTHIFYSLALALIAVQTGWPELQSAIGGLHGKALSPRAEQNLTALADALETADASSFDEFVAASSEKTNTREQRATRILWLAKAICDADF